MSAQEPIHVVVRREGGCLSGCLTVVLVLVVAAALVKLWPLVVGLIVVAAVALGGYLYRERREERRVTRPTTCSTCGHVMVGDQVRCENCGERFF